jgi:hypothetical protein
MLSNMHVERESLQTAMHHELLAIECNYTNMLQVVYAVCALCVRCVCACVRVRVRARACQLSKRRCINDATRVMYLHVNRSIYMWSGSAKNRGGGCHSKNQER